MKAKELIELLSQAPEAEVGYEHLKITNAWIESDKYIELDGQIAKAEYENQTSGVFVVLTEYVDMPAEVNAVYPTREKAEKMRDWLLKCPTKDLNGHGDIKSINIQNMFILR